MAFARPKGFKIDLETNPISGPASWIFVIILNFILTPIFEIEVHTKKFLDTKKTNFRSPILEHFLAIRSHG